MRKILLSFLVLVFASACGQNTSQVRDQGNWAHGILSALNLDNTQDRILVVSENNTPLAHARVLIGYVQNNPFQGNMLETDDQGFADIPTEWTDAQPVTVHADGYIRQTYLDQSPHALVFKLNRAPVEGYYEVKGKATGLPVVEDDGRVDLSLVIPTMTREDLLAFDLAKVLSPFEDPIDVRGDTTYLSSNFSVPRQTESYFIFDVTLDKPAYRLYIDQPGTHKFFAVRASFPFKPVASGLRDKKPFHELINYVSFNGGSVKELNITATSNVLDMPVNDMSFKEKKVLKAPAIMGDEVMLGVGVAKIQGDLIPTDVKRFNSNETKNLTVVAQAEPQMVAVLKKSADLVEGSPTKDRMSSVILPFTDSMIPQFLPLIEKPKALPGGEFNLPTVKNIQGVNPLATFALISEIRQYGGTAGKKITAYKKKWEVYGSQWINHLKLPVWPETTSPTAAKLHLDVSFLGSQTVKESELGAGLANVSTHVTHNAVDF